MTSAASDHALYTPARAPASARQAAIAEMINRCGFATVSQIASSFAVTEMTVRRDLQTLDEKGMVVRTHGGGLSLRRHEVFDAAEPEFPIRRRRNSSAKAAIARAAAGLISERDSIGLDVGTSTLALAEHIADRRDITVFTSSLHVAAALSRSGGSVHVLGGLMRGPELSVVGTTAIGQIRQFYLSKYFLGASGLNEDGYFDYSPEDTEVKQAFIDQAEAVIVLCDASKFDHRSVSKVCELGRAATVITDAPPPSHLSRALEREGVDLILANPIGR